MATTSIRGRTSSARAGRAARKAPMLGPEAERAYLIRIQDEDDPAAMSLLLASHLRLVVSIAQKYARHGSPMDDLIAEGNLGLVEAVRRFDRTRQTRFATYAAWWVRALVSRYAMATRRIVPLPSTRNARRLLGRLGATRRQLSARLGAPPTDEQVALELNVSVEDVEMVDAALRARDVAVGPAGAEGAAHDVASPAPSPEEAVAECEVRSFNARLVSDALAELGARERVIVEKRLLEDDAPTLVALGLMLGLSRERVRQLEALACGQLRCALQHRVA